MAEQELKELTLENLRIARACEPELEWITPLLEANDPLVCEKLFTHNIDWFNWAVGKSFDVYGRLSQEFLAAHEMLPSSTSGYGAPSSTSGYGAPSSTSGYGAPSSTSGDWAPSSTSGDWAPSSTSGRCGFAFVIGQKSRARGLRDGCCLIAAYYNSDFTKAYVATGTVGEGGIESGVWYEADGSTGKLVRSDDQSEPEWEPSGANS